MKEWALSCNNQNSNTTIISMISDIANASEQLKKSLTSIQRHHTSY